MVILELNERDAQLFLAFQRNYEEFVLLLENRVFDLRNGRAELHFNHQGQIASIDLHSKVFKRAISLDEAVAVVKKVI